MRGLMSSIVCLLALIGCTTVAVPPPEPSASPLTGRLTFAGSTTMQPLVEKLADAYRQTHQEMVLEIAAGGSVIGINAVQEGSVDIGMASRELHPDEMRPGMELFPIAFDALAMIVNPTNPVRGISFAQLQGIYTGKITNWRELGGADLPILPVVREVSSGTRGAFDDIVLGKEQLAPAAVARVTAGEVETVVAKEAGAIGYVGFGNLKADVTAIAIDGAAPTPQSIQSGNYRLKRPLALLLGPLSRPQARAFVEFARSPEGQRLIAADGWVPIHSP